MTWIIFILLLNLLFFGMTAGLFLRIRQDVDYLRHEKEEHIDLVQKFMQSVVSHDDMKKYLDEIKQQVRELSCLKEENSKEKWKKFQSAFGGKEEELD